ncbi:MULTISPECIES: uridine kinase [Clostridium]|uniref:Uridine kinase n=2 Tax=Clostridium novyi TaxID=1542 RepID=URK_CLONN|nr:MULTISPECIES: uridine kinase [Clostridium]A0Q140.1 RecName: Full=Uridine kinase; AltName: Full=Cytidine monophosphokinase; AltName: Full=Uridine monophosphokinase [Clostridium novyi NT]ABK61121.1 uridine kinase [Clostridium novyi NT]KEH87402.1 uridine kinase [Clostridium novyi A str. NCTC 538]KEH87762.1 uridine kinase [Clostridium novyi A str. 4540]KEH89240.1 uridine kinase [Clostridium novyi A str. BKT29909]KEH93150.1 uridine kinase [Clostridium botulinum C/D str. It1]
MMRPILIGITGGTGSGKSTVANEIYESFKDDCIAIIEQDSYYKDQSHLTFEDRIKTNYDHPNAFDTELLVEHLKELSKGNTINKPIYDFKEHTRKKEVVEVKAKDIIIVEGIMILQDVELRNLLDIKIYVDTDDDVRIIRRILRDIKERGRTIDSVVDQYLGVVKPMHSQFIEPTKKYADIIIPEGGQNKVAIDIMVSKIKQILSENK